MQVSSQDGTQTQDCLVSKTLIQYRMNFCRALCASYDPHTIYKKDSFFLWVKRQNSDAWQPWTPATVATLDPFYGGNPGPLLQWQPWTPSKVYHFLHFSASTASPGGPAGAETTNPRLMGPSECHTPTWPLVSQPSSTCWPFSTIYLWYLLPPLHCL